MYYSQEYQTYISFFFHRLKYVLILKIKLFTVLPKITFVTENRSICRFQ